MGATMEGITVTRTQIVSDGNDESLISASGSFKLGFFSPSSSKNRYLGIWYENIPEMTVVWVANRTIPLVDKSGILRILSRRILVLSNGNRTTIWSSNTPSKSTNDPIAQLLDSGNLVVRDANDGSPGNFLWQSFDYPSDTLLPGMKLGKNLVTGLEHHLSSWRSSDNPAMGDYTYGVDPSGYPQSIIKKGLVEKFRSGPWNRRRYAHLKPNSIYSYDFVNNAEEVSYSYQLLNRSVISRLVMNLTGAVQRWTWIDQAQGWVLYLYSPTDICDEYAKCGAYGNCNVYNSPVCGCLNTFEPKYPAAWNRSDWSNGCVRRTPLNCHNEDGFLKYSNVKLPDTRHSWLGRGMNLQECKEACLKNCSCMAYENLDVRVEGSGCLFWSGDLFDIRELGENEEDIYIRVASSELDYIGHSTSKKGKIIGVTLALLMGMLLLGLILTCYVWKRKKNSQLKGEAGSMMHDSIQAHISGAPRHDLGLPFFDFATLANATNSFSLGNRIGEGGFGPVYKGVLEDGKEIAVKRLSMNSSQGLDEFKNEVICIAKLQHRNLVKLLGCCIEGHKKMLVYEYMPNKSLDYFIFDQTRSTLLDWPLRFCIINGIARGLLYLHQDSRSRIIHRDLKASNILLDISMNPKISNFGVARSFGENEIEATTKRVVGTHGYMSPEYAVDGLFSIKSYVFSFGVLVLEIVSGKRNRRFFHQDHSLNLLGHAWKLFNEGRSLELIDSSLEKNCEVSQVLRSIHVGLLCVQQCPEDRPRMSAVVLMLGSEGALVQPKQPGFFTERSNPSEFDSSSSKQATGSLNEITTTVLEGR